MDDAIGRFWAWWATAKDELARALREDRRIAPDQVRAIAARVRAIGELDWELTPGTTARHALCLSANGDPRARSVTEAWRRRGPRADATWEYWSARPPTTLPRLVIDGVTLEREDLRARFTIDDDRERVDATYFHPGLRALPEGRRTPALFLLLDGAFGEDGVERWLGRIDRTDLPIATPFAALRDAVSALARRATGTCLVRLRGRDASVELRRNLALKRIDHLAFTTHLTVTLAAPLDDLDALEAELAAALGPAAVYAGRDTTPDRCILHWYTADDDTAPAIVARWAGARSVQIETHPDPTWTRIAP